MASPTVGDEFVIVEPAAEVARVVRAKFDDEFAGKVVSVPYRNPEWTMPGTGPWVALGWHVVRHPGRVTFPWAITYGLETGVLRVHPCGVSMHPKFLMDPEGDSWEGPDYQSEVYRRVLVEWLCADGWRRSPRSQYAHDRFPAETVLVDAAHKIRTKNSVLTWRKAEELHPVWEARKPKVMASIRSIQDAARSGLLRRRSSKFRRPRIG